MLKILPGVKQERRIIILYILEQIIQNKILQQMTRAIIVSRKKTYSPPVLECIISSIDRIRLVNYYGTAVEDEAHQSAQTPDRCREESIVGTGTVQ